MAQEGAGGPAPFDGLVGWAGRWGSVTTAWFSRLLVIMLLLETGAVLIVVPWSVFWERNLFLEWFPLLEGFLTNHFVRGAVSGLGVVNMLVGLSDLASLVLKRVIDRPTHGVRRPAWTVRIRAPRAANPSVVPFRDPERSHDGRRPTEEATPRRAGAER